MAITAYQTSLSCYLCKVNIHVLPETGEREEKRRGCQRQREVGKEEEGGKNEEEGAEEFTMRERRGRKDGGETGGRRGKKRTQGAREGKCEWWSAFLMHIVRSGVWQQECSPHSRTCCPFES